MPEDNAGEGLTRAGRTAQRNVDDDSSRPDSAAAGSGHRDGRYEVKLRVYLLSDERPSAAICSSASSWRDHVCESGQTLHHGSRSHYRCASLSSLDSLTATLVLVPAARALSVSKGTDRQTGTSQRRPAKSWRRHAHDGALLAARPLTPSSTHLHRGRGKEEVRWWLQPVLAILPSRRPVLDSCDGLERSTSWGGAHSLRSRRFVWWASTAPKNHWMSELRTPLQKP